MINGFHFAGLAPPLLSIRASPMVPSIHDCLLSYCLFVCVTYVAQAVNEAARRAYFYERGVSHRSTTNCLAEKIKLEFQTDDIKDYEIDRGYVS